MIKTPLRFSDYIIFADESGDQSLTAINPEFPVLALVFCIFKKIDYISVVKPTVAQFKLDFWGHDLVILHNHAIRKSTGEFAFLFNEERRRIFLHALNEMIGNISFSIAATVIAKRNLRNDFVLDNPYNLALESCLEQAYCFLEDKGQLQNLTHLLVESRGRSEDRNLEALFKAISLRISPNPYPLDIRFVNKQANSSGLQIADLVAYPIARNAINPEQPNKAFDIVKEKLCGYPKYEENGIRHRPLESEKPRHMPRLDADRELPVHL